MKLMFYFLLALTAIFAATANAGGPVLDADGDIIFNGSYYVLPLVWGPAGGGLTLTSGDYKKCPLYIGQDSSEVNMGIPIKFSNWKSKVGFVPESESLSIEMDTKATICGQSTYWWVAAPDMPKMLFVTAGPNPKEHVEDSRRSFFQIKKAEDFRIGALGLRGSDFFSEGSLLREALSGLHESVRAARPIRIAGHRFAAVRDDADQEAP